MKKKIRPKERSRVASNCATVQKTHAKKVRFFAHVSKQIMDISEFCLYKDHSIYVTYRSYQTDLKSVSAFVRLVDFSSFHHTKKRCAATEAA